MSLKGEGGEKDPAEAVQWFRAAAEQGVDESQYYLGVCLINGEGCPKNREEGLGLLRLAARQGYEEAQKLLKRLEEDSR
ncbi:MAG: sel1 repeat family protein [Thermoguttaceae bacterium]|nr:sel1 repeat family protein [Thermoguttaceae bacterium]